MTAPGVDFVVLTGFLGSGKTTLLRDYLAGADAADTAVIVNEVGEIGLDGVILRESGSDVRMTMLSNGCVCCQAGSDLARTVDVLLTAERPGARGPLRRIVLETSGLSKPGPVLRQLAGLAGHRMRVCVLATFDAVRGTTARDFDEAAAQWAAAHRIVMTKTDAVSAERLGEAEAEVAALNPLAEIVVTVDRRKAVAAAFGPLGGLQPMPDISRAIVEADSVAARRAGSLPPCGGGSGKGVLRQAPSAPHDPHPQPLPARARGVPAPCPSPHPRIAVRLVRPAATLAYDDLAAWLDNLAGALGERLLRLKGLVQVVESAAPILVQSVGTLFSAPRPFGAPDAAAPSFMVIIARDLDDAELDGVMPTGLFRFSPWAEPTAFSRTSGTQVLKAEWV